MRNPYQPSIFHNNHDQLTESRKLTQDHALSIGQLRFSQENFILAKLLGKKTQTGSATIRSRKRFTN